MSEQRPSLLEFPCDFPLKAIGLSQDGLEALVVGIVIRHAPDLDQSTVACRLSGAGKYTGVSLTVRAQSQDQLDAIYMDLTACPEVMMVL